MSKCKIALISPMLGYKKTGAASVGLWIIEALKERHELHLITTGTVDFKFLNECWGTAIDPNDINLVKVPQFFLKYTNRFTAFRYALLGRFCKRMADKFDIMFSTYNIFDFGKRGIQYIADFLFSDRLRSLLYKLPEKKEKGWLYRESFMRTAYLKLGKLLYRPSKERMMANLTLVNSEWSNKVMKKIYGIDGVVVYPPVAGEFPSVPWEKKENGFVCIAKLVPIKEVEKSIEILSRVRKKGFDIHLHIIGWIENSHYARMIESLCEKNRSWCFLEGGVYGEDKINLIALHKFGINTCPNEAFGVAVTEMVKAGNIVFVPDSGGQVEIVNHPDLTFVDVDDAAEKIESVLKSIPHQDKLRRHLEVQSKFFTVEKFKSQIRDAVQRFLEEEKRN